MPTAPHLTLPRNHETEIKLRYEGTARSARAMIERRGYKMIEPRTLEADQLFDRAGELKNSDQLLRLRRAGRTGKKLSTITYKGPGERSRHKSREEIEFDVSDPEALTLVLHRLGYHPAFRYEKYRTKFSRSSDKGIITIDETPMGIFLEIEGAPDWIDKTAARLGYSPQHYLTRSYASLYRQYRSAHKRAPQDMIFPLRRARRTMGKHT